MKIKIVFCFVLFLILVSTACRKQRLEKYNPDFEGLWSTDTMTLSNGKKARCILKIKGKDSWYGFMCNANCDEICDCQLHFFGTAKIDKKKKLIYIGYNKISQLQIVREPFLNSFGKYQCELGTLIYYKQ